APGGRRAYLLDLSVDGDGRVVLALGNPDLADNVVTYVPGAGTTLAGVEGHLRRTEVLAAEMDRWDGTDRSAAVYWLGYDAPDWGLTTANPLSGGPAATAAADLRRFAEGLRATHAGGGSTTTFLGHSYGSTVVGRAAVDGLAADRLVFLGSPESWPSAPRTFASTAIRAGTSGRRRRTTTSSGTPPTASTARTRPRPSSVARSSPPHPTEATPATGTRATPPARGWR